MISTVSFLYLYVRAYYAPQSHTSGTLPAVHSSACYIRISSMITFNDKNNLLKVAAVTEATNRLAS